MDRQQGQAILFELLRSFTSLARTLNLSQTVRDLGSTRQTVRRHIAILEEVRGEGLFELDERQYVLTPAGEHALQEAQDILARGEAWLKKQSGHINGLFHVLLDPEVDPDAPIFYYLQQHPISRIWTQGSELMQKTVRAWAESGGEVETEKFEEIRRHALMFRKHDADWLCTEVGKDSAYSEWFGWSWARSSVGRPIGNFPGGSSFASLLSQPFHEVHATHGLRYDHVFTQIVRGDERELTALSYERLIVGGRYPDGSPVLVSVVNRTDNVEIKDVDPKRIQRAQKEFETIQ